MASSAMRFTVLAVLLVFCTHSAVGQELAFGDASFVDRIKARMSQIYEYASDEHVLLTSQSLQSDTASSIELRTGIPAGRQFSGAWPYLQTMNCVSDIHR